MKSSYVLVVAALSGAGTHGLLPSGVPIKWMGSDGQEHVVMPKGLEVDPVESVPPQSLTTMDPLVDMPAGAIPRFTVKSGGAIAWDKHLDWCIEALAGAQRGSTVRMNWCSGSPDQKWTWIPDGHGRDMIQLKGTNKCLGKDGSDGAPIILSECENAASAAWKFEETEPHPNLARLVQSRISSIMRHARISMLALVVIGAVSLAAGLWQKSVGARKAALALGGSSTNMGLAGGISLTSPSAMREEITILEFDKSAGSQPSAPLQTRSPVLADGAGIAARSMPLQTTVIGSFPKPEYVKAPDWFRTGTGGDSKMATEEYTKLLETQTDAEIEQLERDFMRATNDIITIQHECGVDVVTDGEVRRENYIHYLCRFIEGIDFHNLTEKEVRNGAYTTALPTVRGKVSWKGPLDVAAEWKKAQEVSSVPVKYTLPGPMTIIGTLHNAHYEKEEELASDLAEIINYHAVALANHGCNFIQVDEPVFAREPEKALNWGIGLLDKCFEGVGKECTKVLHMCCGYPEYLDQVGYKKADPSSYFKLAEDLDRTCIDAISIEDAHRPNDLSLLKKFKQTSIILGVVKIADSRVETVEDIEDRLTEALKYIDPERLIVAPDCGLALLPLPILKDKLSNMCKAAKKCGCQKEKATWGYQHEEAE